MNENHRATARRAARCAALALPVLLAGCAGAPERPVPQAIREPPGGDLQLVEARQAPERYIGSRVRWGGTVVWVQRDAGGIATVEVLERRLDAGGRPLPGSASDGRFVIRAAPDVDSSLYRRGNDITVAGTVEAVIDGRIGDETVRLPVVRVDAFALWPPLYHPDPWYPYGYPYRYGYDPWFYGPRAHFGIGAGHIRHRRYGGIRRRGLHGHYRHGATWY